jgi:hypothetical protein
MKLIKLSNNETHREDFGHELVCPSIIHKTLGTISRFCELE